VSIANCDPGPLALSSAVPKSAHALAFGLEFANLLIVSTVVRIGFPSAARKFRVETATVAEYGHERLILAV
jgi:hypothetical protein